MIAFSSADTRTRLAGRVRWRPQYQASRTRRQRYAVFGVITLLHLAVFWLMASAIRFGMPGPRTSGNATELQIRLLSPNLGPRQALAPPLDWTFDTPESVVVPEPEISIVPERQDPNGANVTFMKRKVPPRIDPQHINDMPELPHTLGAIRAIALELRVLVLPDGSIGDAEIIHSSGEQDIDRIGIETVRNSWRYIPAMVNGKPVEAWTTVIVRFAAI